MITKSQLDEMLKNKGVSIESSEFIHASIEEKVKRKLSDILYFTIPGIPVSCPRMTQRDKWMKRPCVMKYREYSDRLRKFVNLNDLYVGKVTMKFYLPMPESWSLKKIQYMAGQLHRVKPDYDNLAKGVGDSLFENDSMIWSAYIEKYWAQPGKERTELTFEA